jgi:ATP-dependent DNA helicase RecG
MNLTDPVTTIPTVGPAFAKKLGKLGISTIEDLLFNPPTRYVDYSTTSSIKNLRIGDTTTIVGEVIFIKNAYTKAGKNIQVATISDGIDQIPAVWFNQYYLTRTLPEGTTVSLSGRVAFWNKKPALMFPQFEKLTSTGGPTIHTGGLIPIYHETSGVSSKWLRHKIHLALQSIELADFIDQSTKNTYDLPDLYESLLNIHKPQNENDIPKGRQRLAWNELLGHQIINNLHKLEWSEHRPTTQLNFDKKNLNEFIENLSFELTPSQLRSINETTNDLTKNEPMNRLLEGDVGSGKTIVAAAAAFVTFLGGGKTFYLAPTQILATQHFHTFKSLLETYQIRVELITSKIKIKTLGNADVSIGTHSLLHDAERRPPELLIIDEQHRFGVKQRAHFNHYKTTAPHILTMTATPIPRTVALTLYGELDLSTLDHMPHGHKKITTWVITPSKQENAYKWIEEQITGSAAQVFVVCPFIEESEAEKLTEVTAAKVQFQKLRSLFPKLKIGLMHGRLKPKEKDDIISDFKNKKYQMLVSTPVIEVGIDIPHASIMVIESADRFGLAQLHQLRGRVGRQGQKSYCMLFTDNTSQKSRERLTALTKHHTGRELAEIDLKSRGSGEIFGTRQSGETELKFANWTDVDLIKQTKNLSEEIVKNQKKYSIIIKYYRDHQISPN